mmetsp:Transcript_52182/g.87001  ORF Transcript_52182/g.87001 Transcript_52182/m.87001 type:complete len:352 (+) Transcript_52182:226-1281(+)
MTVACSGALLGIAQTRLDWKGERAFVGVCMARGEGRAWKGWLGGCTMRVRRSVRTRNTNGLRSITSSAFLEAKNHMRNSRSSRVRPNVSTTMSNNWRVVWRGRCPSSWARSNSWRAMSSISERFCSTQLVLMCAKKSLAYSTAWSRGNVGIGWLSLMVFRGLGLPALINVVSSFASLCLKSSYIRSNGVMVELLYWSPEWMGCGVMSGLKESFLKSSASCFSYLAISFSIRSFLKAPSACNRACTFGVFPSSFSCWGCAVMWGVKVHSGSSLAASLNVAFLSFHHCFSRSSFSSLHNLRVAMSSAVMDAEMKLRTSAYGYFLRGVPWVCGGCVSMPSLGSSCVGTTGLSED